MPLYDSSGQPIGAGEEKTEGGLVVPKGAAPRKERTITNCDWKNVRRTVRLLGRQNIATRLACLDCNTIMEPLEDRVALRCQCSTWEIKRC